MAEPFDIKKFFDFSPEAIGKSIGVGLKIGAVIGLGFCIFFTVKSLFKKPAPSQPITVGDGGVVNIHNEAQKKHLIWFVEPWFGVSNRNDKGELGIRTGCKWEF